MHPRGWVDTRRRNHDDRARGVAALTLTDHCSDLTNAAGGAMPMTDLPQMALRRKTVKIESLLENLGAPARRAIEGLGLRRVEDLARYSEDRIREVHGIGPKAIRLMTETLAAIGRSWSPGGHAAVDDYIATFPTSTRKRLTAIRRVIHAEAPGAAEKIGYGIPTYVLNGNLVHFAGYGAHVGFYPGAAAIEHFERELASYHRARGSVQLPHDRPLPLELVRRIVRFRVRANLAKQPRP